MKTLRVVLFALATLCSGVVPAYAAPAVIWSIGQKDNSGKEFGLDHQLKKFKSEIHSDFVYAVGKDQPSKWPYIHPGPIDRWANQTTHPLTVRFDLAETPKGQCALLIHTLGTFAGAQEKMLVSINGTTTTENLPQGPGDEVLRDETKAVPASTRIEFFPDMLKVGTNEITLTVADGAWALYDSVELQSDEVKAPERLTNLQCETTPCFTTGTQSQGIGLCQVIRGSVSNKGPACMATVRTSYAIPHRRERGATEIINGSVEGPPDHFEFGQNSFEVLVPATESATTVTIEVQSGTESHRTQVSLVPQRKWKLYLQPSIHTDIGYTDRQADVMHRHNANLDKVMAMAESNPLFKWSIEVAWEVENYFNDRPTTAQQELVSLMKQGRLGLNGGYLNLLTSLMSDEAMNHYAYYAANLRRKYGIPFDTSLMTDIPSATRGLVSAMAASGIKYFAEGCNEDRGPVIANSGIHAPFYWQGPDGAKVLTWLSQGYAQSAWLAQSRDVNALYENVAGVIRGHERRGDEYPFDAAYLYGAFLDNSEVDTRYGALLKEWNARYAYPQIIVSRGPEFFEYLEANFRDKIATRAVDFGAFWEDGAGSTQQETTMHMDNQRRLSSAETLWALATLGGARAAYPLSRIQKSWEDILFYIEHTWGAAQSISAPDDPMTKDQWEAKAEYARRPDKETRALATEGMNAFLSTIPANKWDVVIFNPSSWPRSGAVELPLIPTGARTHNPIPQFETVGHQILEYTWVDDIPAYGYKVVPSTTEDTPVAAGEEVKLGTMENQYYRVEFSGANGITRVFDKETQKDLLDKSSPFAFGQLVYAAGGEATRMIHPDRGPEADFVLNTPHTNGVPPHTVLLTRAQIVRAGDEPSKGPLWQEAEFWSASPSMQKIRTLVRLHEKEKRISVDVTITSKTEEHGKEAVYVAFPFAGSAPQFRLGMSNAIQRPDKDFAHGACHEWYCVQDFVACADSKNATEVVWTSPDAPLVCLGDVNRGRWLADAQVSTATIFSYVMNNYWHTNYKAGQGGDFHFRYDITSGKAGMTNEQCIHFARETASPLVATVSPGAKPTHRVPAITVSGTGVVIGTIKEPEDCNGTVFRLRNVEDHATTAQLKVTGASFSHAELLNVVEDATSTTLQFGNSGIVVPMKPQQIATVRLY